MVCHKHTCTHILYRYKYKIHAHTISARSCVFLLCAYREDFGLEKVEQENQARALLEQTISMLQSIAQQNANVVDKMKLMQMSRNMVRGPCCSVVPRVGFEFFLVFLTGKNKRWLFAVKVACK